MNQTPLVSVLMTTYNREDFVGEAIDSVLASTYENLELVLVDDCSKDRTVEILRDYAAKDPRVKVHVNEQNLGDYPNRRKACSLAQGEYLKFVDSDDYLYPRGLEVLVEGMSRFPDAGYGLCSLRQFNARPFPFKLNEREAYLEHYFGQTIFTKAPLSAIIKRSAYEAVGGFITERMIGDMDMWHRLSTRYPVVLMQDGVVWAREHDGRETEARQAIDPKVHYHVLYQEITLKMLANPNVPLTAEEKKKIADRYFISNMKFATKLTARGYLKHAKTIFDHARRFRSVVTPSDNAGPPASMKAMRGNS